MQGNGVHTIRYNMEESIYARCHDIAEGWVCCIALGSVSLFPQTQATQDSRSPSTMPFLPGPTSLKHWH